MDVTQASSRSQTGAPSSGKNALSADFQTFLKMLTVQMQNQDPLNPIEASDYAVQLATFSGVEQSVRTNQLLEAMQQQFGILSMSQLAGWVGQEARANAPVHVQGEPVTISAQPASTADRAVLVVTNVSGQVVARENFPLSSETMAWTPLDAAGSPLPTGLYDLSVESYFGDTKLSTTHVEHYARILEAQGGPDGTKLILSGGVEIAATQITALRVPVSN